MKLLFKFNLIFVLVMALVPQPASSVEGGPQPRHGLFDAVIAKALAKEPADRYVNATALRDALAQVFVTSSGQAVPAAVAREAVCALPFASDYAPTERIAREPTAAASSPTGAHANPPSTGSAAPAHWDAAVLARAETALARHVGPLAGVMVRRAARECHDVTALYVRLGEQITQASAREAFLGLVTGSGARPAGTGGSRGGMSSQAPPPTSNSSVPAGGAPVSDALLEQAQKLLAAHVGPIAKVVVKRAAERTRQRTALFALLADAVPDAARERVLADLARLA